MHEDLRSLQAGIDGLQRKVVQVGGGMVVAILATLITVLATLITVVTTQT